MEKKFSASFKKKGKDLYNIALEAILNLDLKLVSEDDKEKFFHALHWNLRLKLSFVINSIKLFSNFFRLISSIIIPFFFTISGMPPWFEAIILIP